MLRPTAQFAMELNRTRDSGLAVHRDERAANAKSLVTEAFGRFMGRRAVRQPSQLDIAPSLRLQDSTWSIGDEV
jgi:hypothetical protein